MADNVPWWETLPDDATPEEVAQAILNDPNVDPSKTLNQIFQEHVDRARSQQGIIGADSYDPPWLSGGGQPGAPGWVSTSGDLFSDSAKDTNEVSARIDGLLTPVPHTPTGDMALDPVMVAGIPLGVLQARQGIGDLDLTRSQLEDMGLEDYQIESLLGMADTPSETDTLSDILGPDSDLFGDSDLEGSGPTDIEIDSLVSGFQGQINERLEQMQPTSSSGDDPFDRLFKQYRAKIEQAMLGDLGIGIRINGNGSKDIIFTLPIPLLPPSVGEIPLQDANGNIVLNTESITNKATEIWDHVASIPGKIADAATGAIGVLTEAGQDIGGINGVGDILDIAGNVIGSIFNEETEGLVDSEAFQTGDLLGQVLNSVADNLDLPFGDHADWEEDDTIPDLTAEEAKQLADSEGAQGGAGSESGVAPEPPEAPLKVATNTMEAPEPVVDPVGWSGDGLLSTGDSPEPKTAVNTMDNTRTGGETPVGWTGRPDPKVATNSFDNTGTGGETPVDWAGQSTQDPADDDLKVATNQMDRSDPVVDPVGWSGTTTTEEPPVGTTPDSGGGGGGGGGQTDGFMGGLSYQLAPSRSVIYDARDPMIQLNDMINRSLFKDVI